MDDRAEVRDFLTTRRAEVSAARVGLREVGQRRVVGLRRSEVAALAGISEEHYAKLERGVLAGVSASVLEGLARALQLDDAERSHLGPATVRNGRTDLLATHTLGLAVHSSVHESAAACGSDRRRGAAGAPPNFTRCTFLDADSRRSYPDWDTAAAVCVQILRTEAGRDPHDKDMHDLVGELSTRSETFRALWGSHDVRLHGAGTKTFHHTVVGDLEVAHESADVVAEPDPVRRRPCEPHGPGAGAARLLGRHRGAPARRARAAATHGPLTTATERCCAGNLHLWSTQA